jgi:hypothetical protein
MPTTFTFDNQYNFADDAQRDAFGRIRISETTSLVELKHSYSAQDDLESTVVASSKSTYTYLPSRSVVTLNIVSGGAFEYVIRQSRVSAPYQPGKSQIFEASFVNMIPEGQSVKRVGAYTSTLAPDYSGDLDGFFLQCDWRGVWTFEIWNEGNPIFILDSTSWLTNDYDPNLIDWSLSQLMMVDYQWLGVGRVRFYLVIEGIPRLFAEYSHAGSGGGVGVYMLRPNLPIRYEIRDDNASGEAASLTQICSQISTEGSLNSLQKVTTSTKTVTNVPRSGRSAILGFRIRNTRKSTNAKVKSFSIIQTSSRPTDFIVQVQRNPTYTATIPWSTATNTPIEFGQDTRGPLSIPLTSNGDEICTYIGNSTYNIGGPLNLENSAYGAGIGVDGVADEFWICVEPLDNNANYTVALNVEYYD